MCLLSPTKFYTYRNLGNSNISAKDLLCNKTKTTFWCAFCHLQSSTNIGTWATQISLPRIFYVTRPRQHSGVPSVTYKVLHIGTWETQISLPRIFYVTRPLETTFWYAFCHLQSSTNISELGQPKYLCQGSSM